MVVASMGLIAVHKAQRPGTAGDFRGPSAADVQRPMDINTAESTELASLPGIGPVLARRIVEEREVRGPFRSIDDLRRVRGIGPRLLRQIERRATVR